MKNNSDFLRKYNQPNKILSLEEEQKVVDLYKSGLSSIQISKIYGCSKRVILRALKNIPKRKATEYSSHFSKNQGYGSKHHSWKGGYKDIYSKFRDLSKYYEWRNSVILRDGSKCTDCHSTKKLHAHHIKTLKSLINDFCRLNNLQINQLTYGHLNNEYFYNLSNGLTLCECCHKKWHKINGR